MTARAPFGDLLEQSLVVEALGYETIWIPEITGRDAFVTVAALASRTDTVNLATGIVPLPSRPLPALAMAAAAVAELAPGRFVLGLGAGHRETARTRFGWQGPATVAEIEAALTSLKGALADGQLCFPGPDGPASLVLKGTHVGVAPPLVLAAMGPRMAGLAGRMADGLLLNWATVPHATDQVRTACATAGVRPFTVACYVPVCVTDDVDAARREVIRQLSSYLRLRAYSEPLARYGYADAVDLVLSDQNHADRGPVSALVDAVAAIGDEAAVRDRLELYRAAGVTELVIAPVAVGDGPDDSLMATWTALAPR